LVVVEVNVLLRGIAAILDGIDVAMCGFDSNDCTLVWNRAFLRFFPEHAGHVHVGEPYRSNLRRFYEGRLDPAERASIDRYIDEGIARHRSQQRPFTFCHLGTWLQVASLSLPGGGSLRIWRRIAAPRLGDPGEGSSAMHAAALADSREIFEHVGDGVMLTSAENRITWVNDHFVHLFSVTDKSAAIGLQFEDVYQAAWRDRAPAERPAFESGQSTLTENLRFAGAPFELPLPGRRWVRVIEQRRRDGIGFFAIVDISMLKIQQQELIAAERRALESQARLEEKSRMLEATLARMEQGVLMVNADQVVEVCNRRAIELLQLPADLMASRPTFDQVLEYQWSTDEFSRTPESVKEFVRAGGILDQPQLYDRERPNGSVIEIRSVPIEGGGVLRTYTDITERRRSETTHRALEEKLREAQKLESIGTLAGGIAHDFNNIMAAILGNVSFAQSAIRAGDSADQYLHQIKTAGSRARSLVHQILAFSRKQAKEFVNVSLRPLLEETVTMLRSTVGGEVEVRSSLSEQKLSVMGNSTQLQQVILNLGTNAWHALRGASGRIEIGLEQVELDGTSLFNSEGPARGSHAHIWVRDDGCGMTRQTRERIFEPFFTTKPVGEGTGLGLSVAHGIVEAHGGVFEVRSAVGSGSTFGVYLPLVDHETQAMPLDVMDTGPARGQGQHVLYIDDDEVMSVMVHGLLVRLGYRATCLTDPREAIALVARDPGGIDLVVTDFNMPQFTGLDVVRALSTISPKLPVAISSGYISEELRSSAMELGVCELMHKEHTLEELGELVHRALSAGPDDRVRSG
jgi:signal transduction histidine kinase/ActR/RegA family two-component response regulator